MDVPEVKGGPDLRPADDSSYAIINYQFEANSRFLAEVLNPESGTTQVGHQYVINDAVGTELESSCREAAGKSGLVYCNDGLHSRLLVCDPVAEKLGKPSAMVPKLRQVTSGDVTCLLQPLTREGFFAHIEASETVYAAAEQTPVKTEAEGRHLWKLIEQWRLGLGTIKACTDE